MSKYQSAFEEVPMGYDWIKDFVMFSYDVPLSKNFASKGYAILSERYKRILKIHDGYSDLTPKDQVRNIIIKSCSTEKLEVTGQKVI